MHLLKNITTQRTSSRCARKNSWPYDALLEVLRVRKKKISIARSQVKGGVKYTLLTIDIDLAEGNESEIFYSRLVWGEKYFLNLFTIGFNAIRHKEKYNLDPSNGWQAIYIFHWYIYIIFYRYISLLLFLKTVDCPYF